MFHAGVETQPLESSGRSSVLGRTGVSDARIIILACGNDSAPLLAATVARDFAPGVPILACAEGEENLVRIQQAGADFALTVSQVAGQQGPARGIADCLEQPGQFRAIFNIQP